MRGGVRTAETCSGIKNYKQLIDLHNMYYLCRCFGFA